MHILFISQLFDPEYSIKGLALMKHWVEQGHKVEVVTTFPNYPTGRVFPGYKVRIKHDEMIDGVRVVRLWSHISHSKSKMSRAVTYLSFTFMALVYSLYCRKPDVIYTYHPQSTTGFIGVLLKKIKGVPFITDVQDLWPDALIATGLNQDGFLIHIIDRWCHFIYKQAAKIVVLSQGFRKALMDRGVDGEKIHVVYNWCPEEERITDVLSRSKYYPDPSRPTRLIYAGNVGAAQALKSLIDAVGTLPVSDVELIIYGNGVDKELLEEYVFDKLYKNVFFKGYVPPSDLFNILTEADILAVHLRDEELFKITIPSKTQSSMAIGKPLLMAVGGEVNYIVQSSVSGVIAQPESSESIRNALGKLIGDHELWIEMGKNARTFYINNFSIGVNYRKLDRIVEDVK